MVKKHFFLWWIGIVVALTIIFVNPAQAQLPLLPKINLETFKLDRNLTDKITSACVRLEGSCIFELSDQKSNLTQRIKYTEERLADIKKIYLQQKNVVLKVFHQKDNNQQNIYVVVGEQEFPVLTLNSRDATIHGVKLEHYAQQIAHKIEQGFAQAREERQLSFLLQQSKVAGSIFLVMILSSLLFVYWLKRLNQDKANLDPNTVVTDNNAESLTTDLEHRAIEIVERVATEMYHDCDYRPKIIEPPQVLGVEDFADRGFVVRLWFKTEPLKQWEISREFRRRLKNVVEEAGILLSLSQQEIWLNRDNQNN